MFTKPLCFVFLLFFAHLTFSQQPQQVKSLQLDSLHTELAKARHDTTKIRLLFDIGHRSWTTRTGFWDSLARESHKQCLPLFEARAFSKLGFIMNMQGSDDKAIEYYTRALSLAERGAYKNAMLLPLYCLANIYSVSGNTKAALDLCFRGLKIAEELHDKRNIATFNLLLGTIYHYTGEAEKALTHHLSSLQMYREMNYAGGIVEALITLGKMYEVLKDTVNMIKYKLEARKYASGFGGTPAAINLDLNTGEAFELLKQPDSALVFYLKAYTLSQRLHADTWVAQSLMHLAGNCLRRKNYQAAEKYGRECVELAKALNLNYMIPIPSQILKDVYLATKRYKQALEADDLKDDIEASMRSEEKKKLIREKEFAYQFEKKENENRLLLQQNQIQQLKLSQNELLAASFGGLALFIAALALLLIRQSRLRARQQGAQLEQKLLRLQMNPHFIFNSLQAIQGFMATNDGPRAARFLGSFSTVTRSVLESSRLEAISLEKEIALLANYLDLQKLRFGNRFSYEIVVEEGINPAEISIAPMLLQPFVENAIEHGMHNVANDGKISISYRLQNACLLMAVSDNGSGIANTSTSHGYQSLALDITKERVELMNRQKKQKISCNMTEAFPESARKGVLVTFAIPLDNPAQRTF